MTVEYAPEKLMSDRLSRYIEALCRSSGVPFNPGMTCGEARAFVLSRRGACVTRGEGIKVRCPECGAAPSRPCVDDGVARERSHSQRAQQTYFERIAAA